MCLDIVTKRNVKLRKDKVVWKSVDIIKRKEYPVLYNKKSESMMFSDDWSKCPALSRGKIPIITHHIIGCGDNKYNSGSHCFATQKGAKEYIFAGDSTLPYIIPKNTIVLYGRYDDEKVIVTPVLINPRHPAHKNKYKHLL